MKTFLKKFRPFLVVGVLLVTLASFVYFFVSHPEIKHQLGHTPLTLLALLLGLYFVAVLVLGLILIATLVLCRVELRLRESTLLTMYSSIINFFGPLQSGPAFRAVYLKQRHGLKLKDYTLASLVYYALYGGFSLILLFSHWLEWWLVLIGLLGGVVVVWCLRSRQPYALKLQTLNLRGLGLLIAATLAQVLLTCVIYYTELHSVSPGISVWQAVVYTGAANLALFVSITPGAIGFRESFLVFSQHLHHVTSTIIVAANVIDRSVYIVLLLILLGGIVATHGQAKLRLAKDNH